MQRIAAVIFLAAASLASDVLEFHDSDFADKAKEHDIILVEFYAPWCGHCKRLAPEYEKAATKLKDNDPPVSLAKVDCTSDKATCDKFGVSGFPTLKIFRHGELSSDYEGPREADGIVKYMRGQVGPSSREIKNIAALEKFISNEEHSIIGFFESETKLKDSFQKVADTERDRYRFAHTSAKDVLEKYQFTDDIVIFQPPRLHNKFEETYNRYDGNYDTDKIKKFFEHEMHGLVGIRNSETSWQFGKPLVVAYYNVDYVKDPKGTNYWRNRVLKVAKEFKRKVHFAVSDKESFGNELDEFGLGERKDEKAPLVTGHGANGMKYPMNDEFSVENLKKFVEEFQAGKVEPFMKSEQVPDDNDGPVKVVVAKNFDEIVNQDKDVLIEFYAPWCGHCKKLAPTYEELGEKLRDEDVVIAKMDATANDVPSTFQVQGFPTIFWVPKGKKSSPISYRGGREVDDFLAYIAKEATDELKGYKRDGKKKKKTEL
jgi:protein disulfide isomerase family A protein 3